MITYFIPGESSKKNIAPDGVSPADIRIYAGTDKREVKVNDLIVSDVAQGIWLFDAVLTEKINIDNNKSLNRTREMTVAAWIKPKEAIMIFRMTGFILK